jgi:serine/threonine-protein kinase
VAEAHRLGIVHRDLKPANLFLARRPEGSPYIKVLDFGISKLTAEAIDPGEGLTDSRAAVGTPRYMSPEQLNSPRDVGPPADVWAFGCILYELLTGEPAFGGETVHSVGVAIATKPAPKARARRAELPKLVDEIISSCLEKDPSQRIGSVAELALRMAPLAPPSARVSIERICRLTGRPPPMALPTEPAWGPRIPVIGAVLLLAVGLVAVFVINPRNHPSASQATPAPSDHHQPAAATPPPPPSAPQSSSPPALERVLRTEPSSAAVAAVKAGPPKSHALATTPSRPVPSASVATAASSAPPPVVSPLPSGIPSLPTVLQDRK